MTWDHAPPRATGGAVTDGLVGRRDDAATLLAAADRAAAGRPELVVVEGEPGMGKSALTRAVAQQLYRRFLVMWARGEEIERHLDFGTIDQLFREASAAGMPAPSPVSRSTARPDPLEVGETVLALVEEHTRATAAMVVVDDAQWADLASIQALSYVYRRIHHRPVLLVVVHRPDAPQLEPFHRLVRDGRGHRVRLSGLSPEGLAELVLRHTGVSLTPRAAARLHAHTGGNPLESLTLAEELDPASLTSGFGALPAPRSYASMVLNRLSLCTPVAEQIVLAVAVLGVPTELATIHHMLELEDIAAPMSEAIDRSLLRMVTRGGRRVYDVAHPLIRAAVLDDLPPSRLAELHRRAAGVTPDADRAFLHRLRAVVGADEALADEAVARARQQLASGWELSAVDLLVSAAAVLPRGPRRSEAVLLAADRLLDAGDAQAAEQLLHDVPPGSGGALEQFVRGELALADGKLSRAESALERAFAQAPPEGEIAARSAGLLSTMAANAAQAEPALLWSRRALERAVVAQTDVGHALTMLAAGWAMKGDLDAGLREVERWSERLTSPAASRDALFARGMLCLWDGRHDEAEELLRRARGGGSGPLFTMASVDYSLADNAYRQGRWDESLLLAEELAKALDDAGHRLATPMAHGVASFVLAGRGDAERARWHLEAGYRARTLTGVPAGWLWLEVGAARIEIAQGKHEQIAERLLTLSEFFRTIALPEGVQPWRADLVDALVALGRLDEAAAELADLDTRLRGGGAHARVGAARARGVLLAARNDDAGAQAAFTAGLAEDPVAAGPFVRARLELAAGAFQRRRGQRREAAALLTDAAGRFAALGAEPFRARAAAELDLCGLTRQRGSVDDAALTKAEQAVVELVALGRTNREVANELVVSVKTVETHLGKAFTKFGVRTRTELARRWQERPTPDAGA